MTPRLFALAILCLAALLGTLAPSAADQPFGTVTSGAPPTIRPTPTPNLNGYIYYPCYSDPRANAACCGSQGKSGHSNSRSGNGCYGPPPKPHPSHHPAPPPRPQPLSS